MGIAFIIVGGIALVSIVASFFSYLEKKKGRNDTAIEERLKSLEMRVDSLSDSVQEKEGTINKLEADLRFLNRLIEDKTPQTK